MKGQIWRRSMELGGFPLRTTDDLRLITAKGAAEPPWVHHPHKCSAGSQGHGIQGENIESQGHAPRRLSETRLVQVMRKIDPDLARMIELLSPVYLVKK